MSFQINNFDTVEFYNSNNELLAQKSVLYSTHVSNEMLGMMNADFSEDEKIKLFNLIDPELGLSKTELEAMSELSMMQTDYDEQDYTEIYEAYAILTNSKLTVIRVPKECSLVRLINSEAGPIMGDAYIINGNLWVYIGFAASDTIKCFRNYGPYGPELPIIPGITIHVVSSLSSTSELPDDDKCRIDINMNPNELYEVESVNEVEKMILLMNSSLTSLINPSIYIHENSDYPHSELKTKILMAQDFYDMIHKGEIKINGNKTYHNKSNTQLGNGLSQYSELVGFTDRIGTNDSYELVINKTVV